MITMQLYIIAEAKNFIRWPDVIVLVVTFLGLFYIGGYFARKNNSPESYFWAGRKMPGWVVGFSIMATIISSMSFLATPGFAYAENWRYFPPSFGYIFSTILAIYIFMPFFRMGHVNSAYEYLERRFGYWARSYGALCFLMIQICRIGVILYAVSLAVQRMTNWNMALVILLFGITVAFYTIAGGLEAVIWTDVIQGLALIIGALICLPIIIYQIPGGIGQLFDVAMADNKFSVGDMSWDFKIKGFWVMVLTAPFGWSAAACTDQSTIQRYCAPKSRREAVKSLLIGVVLSVPLWAYFSFVGTALYVFYKVVPGKTAILEAPEQIFPHFILTEVPAGLTGFVLVGLIAAAMSTIDTLINSSAATVTTDFYRRLFVKHRDEKHYLAAGRYFSVFFSVIAISTALLIHFASTGTLNDLQNYGYAIFGGGLFGLFLLGFLTKRVDSITAASATFITFILTCLWVFFITPWSKEYFPSIADKTPDIFWSGIISNLVLFSSGFVLALIFRRKSKKDLANLTVWTMDKKFSESN